MTELDPVDAGRALVDFIAGELIDKREDVALGLDTDILASGLIDSLAVMRLVDFIEKSHGVSVHPADITIENFMNVRTIVHYLTELDSGDERQIRS